MAFNNDHAFPVAVEQLLGTLANLCAAKGATRELAVLAVSTGTLRLWQSDSWDGGSWGYRLLLQVPPDLFGRLEAHREALEQSLLDLATSATRQFAGEYITDVVIAPELVAVDNWRAQALAWLNGQGINNQGRVRSDNIAIRQCDGLLFRSQPEIFLYRALKAAGVSFAPLPVFVRGGAAYRRIEPDFVIMQAGTVMAVEVDGDTVHRETPAEAHDRTAMLTHEGVHIERVKASDCDTADRAQACAGRLMGILRKVKDNRA